MSEFGFSEKRRNGLRRVFPYGEFYRCLWRADSERSFAVCVQENARQESTRLAVAERFGVCE